MIVKVVPPSPELAKESAHHFQAHGPIHSGKHYLNAEPRPIVPDVIDYQNTLGLELRQTHVLGVTDNPAEFTFAHWWDPDDGGHLVVTNGQIFILSDRGDTVDRVM